MHLYYRNVNDAFHGLVYGIHNGVFETQKADSRNGPVLKFVDPVTITYSHPQERVLFNSARDCNSFFHMFEALWMLAGRNDVAPLTYYNPRMVDYSDDKTTLSGAYGHRWRSWDSAFDQLKYVIRRLKEDPTDRRSVVAMWDPIEDLFSATDWGGKDLPCNTHIYFSRGELETLDMTVCNRSNDLVWGMLGANYVHFTFLQEYMANCLGWKIGKYHHFTNNLHVYENNWEPEKWLENYDHGKGNAYHSCKTQIVSKQERFDQECPKFIDQIDGDFEEPFLRDVAQPMMAAFRQHKQRNYRGDNNALVLIDRVFAWDWRKAGEKWLERRRDKWETKSK